MMFSKKVFSIRSDIPARMCPRRSKSFENLVWFVGEFASMWLFSINRAWSCKFSTCSLSFNPVVSERVHQVEISNGSGNELSSERFLLKSRNLPGLKSTIAFRQANSAGLTWRFLKRSQINSKWRRITIDSWDRTSKLSVEKRELLSGVDKLHWIAHKTNNSDQLSSNRVTY